jgi:hypothetical protein
MCGGKRFMSSFGFYRLFKYPMLNGLARPQVADTAYGLQIWKVATNILNEQLRRAEKGWYYSLGVGSGANNSSL